MIRIWVNLEHSSQCCQKHQKYLRRAASIWELLAGKILINFHSGVRGERRAKRWRQPGLPGLAGYWSLHCLETPGRRQQRRVWRTGRSSPEIVGDSQCSVQASFSPGSRDQFTNYCDVRCLCFLIEYKRKGGNRFKRTNKKGKEPPKCTAI